MTMIFLNSLVLLALFAIIDHASAIGSTVKLDNGTFTGISAAGVSQFLGIPFAQPPYVGSLKMT